MQAMGAVSYSLVQTTSDQFSELQVVGRILVFLILYYSIPISIISLLFCSIRLAVCTAQGM